MVIHQSNIMKSQRILINTLVEVLHTYRIPLSDTLNENREVLDRTLECVISVISTQTIYFVTYLYTFLFI